MLFKLGMLKGIPQVCAQYMLRNLSTKLNDSDGFSDEASQAQLNNHIFK